MLNDRVELRAAGSKGSDNRNLYVYGDHLGSAILALDGNQREAMRLGYSPFGQVYRKQNTTKFWKLNSGVNANNQLNQLMPYQYTGRYTEGATGYTHLDARWYNPYTQRFNQPDYWSFNNTGLPKSIQHELMRFSGLNTSQLLRDPAQQMRFGYVKNNPLSYIDLNGLDSFIGIRALDTNFPPWGTHSFTIISTTDTSQYGEHEDDFVEMVNTNGTWPGVGEGETFYVMTLAGFNDKGVLVSETDNLQDLAAIYSSLQEEHWTDVFVNDPFDFTATQIPLQNQVESELALIEKYKNYKDNVPYQPFPAQTDKYDANCNVLTNTLFTSVGGTIPSNLSTIDPGITSLLNPGSF